LQASRASDTETLQSQVNKAAKKRLSLSGLEILHGRLVSPRRAELRAGARRAAVHQSLESDTADYNTDPTKNLSPLLANMLAVSVGSTLSSILRKDALQQEKAPAGETGASEFKKRVCRRRRPSS